MGALTLKTFPFELRGWDIEKFESIDPTDGFGISTRVYVSKQQIIQIEPDHSDKTSKPWLTDKGRQFFDGIFGQWNEHNKHSILKKNSWKTSLNRLFKTLYLFEHCSYRTKKARFFTMVFEHLGIETLSLLKIIEKSYPFLKLRKADNLIKSNDLEFNFQLNTVTNSNKLKTSTLCLLIATNSRYEGANLNLDLKQRYFKGNFKCLILGSLIDLTFPNTFLGANVKTLKKIAEGNSFVCQDFKTAKNPILIFNNEFSKQVDGKNALEMFQIYKYTNIFKQTWNGINVLNSTLNEVGIQSIDNFLPLKKKDLNECSLLYFINVNAQTIPNLKKITETKLLKYSHSSKTKPNIKKLFFDQNSNIKNNKSFSKCVNTHQYNFLPVKMFYENEETFMNTEGLIKKTKKLITRRNTREGWKLLRNLLKNFQNQYKALNFTNNFLLTFNAKKPFSFNKFTYFCYCATEKLDNFAPSSVTQNQPFFIWEVNKTFKQKSSKIRNTKTKYWIDDFFIGGKDEYSKNSLILSNCSKILRTQSTNFF